MASDSVAVSLAHLLPSVEEVFDAAQIVLLSERLLHSVIVFCAKLENDVSTSETSSCRPRCSHREWLSLQV